MAAYNGFEVTGVQVDDAIMYSVSIAAFNPATFTTFNIDDIGETLSGDHNGIYYPVQDVFPCATSQCGFYVIGFGDDFYNHVYIIPESIDLGIILSDTVETFIVWNAYFVTAGCTSIVDINLGTLGIAGLATPFNLFGLEYTTYTVTALEDGEAEIDVLRTYIFDLGDEPFIEITGSRSVVFSFEPQKEITESLEWFTDVIVPKDGVAAEQRISVRPIPRQHLKWTIVLPTEQEQIRFDTLLFRQLKRKWGVPIWVNALPHRGTINILDTTITLDTSNTLFEDDSLGIIWQSPTSFEVIRIETIVGSTLTLELPIQNQFLGTKSIMPLKIGYLNSSVQLRDSIRLKANAQVSFLVLNNSLVTGYTPDLEYLSQPVITSHSVLNQSTERSIDSDSIFNDPGIGDLQLISGSEFNIINRAHRFENKTRATCWNFRQFLHSLYGRQKTAWLPTFKKDMILAAPFLNGNTFFYIEDTSNFSRFMQINTLVTHIIFMFTDGEKVCREVLSMADQGDGTEKIAVVALARDVTTTNCQISLLHLCRQTLDQVDISWYQPNQHYSNLDFRVIKNEL